MQELYEVSEYAPKPLKDLERIIKKISRNPKKFEYVDLLKTKLQKITGFSEIYIMMTGEYNAMVMPIYKSSSFILFIKSIIKNLSSKQDVIDPKILKKTLRFQDQNKYVEKVYIYIGRQLFYDLTPAEIVAVLLHEFGHVYSTLVNGSEFFLNFIKQIPFAATVLVPLGIRLKYITEMTNEISTMISHIIILLLLLRILFVHGIKFTQHALEYKSDNFALKYGYGDELINVLTKFSYKKQKTEKLGKNFSDKLLYFLKKFYDFLKNILSPSSHPLDKDRIESLKNQIFNEYRNIYPNYKEFIDIVQADYSKTIFGKR